MRRKGGVTCSRPLVLVEGLMPTGSARSARPAQLKRFRLDNLSNLSVPAALTELLLL